MRDAVDIAKRVLTKERFDKHLSGQTVNSAPVMKMGDTSHPGKKVSINAQDSIREKLENLTSMMYKCLYNRKKVRNHLSHRFIQREEEVKEDKTLTIEMGVGIMIGKDKILDRPRTDVEITAEE